MTTYYKSPGTWPGSAGPPWDRSSRTWPESSGAWRRAQNAKRRPVVQAQTRCPEAKPPTGQRASRSAMSVGLLDVDVLIALLDPAHPNHEDAHAWLRQEPKARLGHMPAHDQRLRPRRQQPRLPHRGRHAGRCHRPPAHAVCAAPSHQFWPDSVSLLDKRLFDPHRQVEPAGVDPLAHEVLRLMSRIMKISTNRQQHAVQHLGEQESCAPAGNPGIRTTPAPTTISSV
jgi:hypothetical protein